MRRLNIKCVQRKIILQQATFFEHWITKHKIQQQPQPQ